MADEHTSVRGELVKRRTMYRPHAAQETFIVPIVQTRIEKALNEYGPGSGGRVLDVGCGEQPFRQAIVDHGWAYVGMDVQQNVTKTVEILAFIDQPLPAALSNVARFDLILCTEVMEHVADWSTAFNNFGQLLSPNGRLIITCPHYFPLHEEPYDFWRATPHVLKHFAQRSGLAVVAQEKLGNGWDVLGTLVGALPPKAAKDTLYSRFVARVAGLARKALFVTMRSQTLREQIELNPGVYISNFAVFERTA